MVTSRTFLFMIKISEEEKIAENLHEIESMQLIVQVIMITVCILIAFIVSYMTINNVWTHKFPLRKLNSRLTVLQFIVK